MANESAEYSTPVWEHFRAPCNAGAFPADTPKVLMGRGGARRHGREVEFQLQVTIHGRIADCRYRVYGCPATIALCSLASGALKDQSLADAAAFSVVALAEQLGLPADKRTAALTVEDAIRAAVKRYNDPAGPRPAAAILAKQV